MPDNKNYDNQLANVMNRLADSVLELSAEETLTEARAEGIDLDKEAERTRNVLRQASKVYRHRKLNEAQRAYEAQVAAIRAKRYELPQSAAKRRDLLRAVFAARPEMQSAVLTAQHRDFTELSDADVESFLKQLKELGVLDSFEFPTE